MKRLAAAILQLASRASQTGEFVRRGLGRPTVNWWRFPVALGRWPRRWQSAFRARNVATAKMKAGLARCRRRK